MAQVVGSTATRLRRYKSARERAYDGFKRALLTCELAPGSSWSESELMARIGIGRTPLREATQQLAHEGLLTVLPRRGILIADISFAQLQQMFELRMELEGFCARLAAQRVTADELAAGRRLLLQDYSGDLDQHFGLDRRFHALVYAAARNGFLEGTLHRLYDWSVRVLYCSGSRQESLPEVRRDHEGLLDALEARDGARAAEVIQQHVAKFREQVRASL